MKIGKILLCNLFFLIVSYKVCAGDTAKQRFVSLDSAIALGLKHSRDVGISAAQVLQSQAALGEVKDLIMPNVDASLGYTRLSNVPIEYFSFPGSAVSVPITDLFPIFLNDYSATASVKENIFNGFQWKYSVLSSDFALKASEFSLQDKISVVSFTIISAYLNLFKLEKAEQLIEGQLKDIKANVKEVSDFQLHGLATENDVLRVKLQESNAELSEIDVTRQIETVNYNLNVMLGLNENTTIAIDTISILADKIIEPLPYYIQKFSDARNDIRAAGMQEKAQEAGIKITRSEIYPRLILSADYNYLRPNPRLYIPINVWEPSWEAGVHITYSLTGLYDSRNKMAESRAKLAEAQANYDRLNDEAKMEINQSYLQFKQALQKINVSEQSLQQASENYRIVKSKYDNHVALLTDLLDAGNLLLNAQINLVSARADAQMAYYNLLKSAGEMLPGQKK